MHFKLIIALVDDSGTDRVMQAAREAGATGATVISAARGEGLEPKRTFFGLAMESARDILLFLVEEHLSRHILESISTTGGFDDKPGTGVAFQIDVEDAVGLGHQIETLMDEVEEQL
jgi:uncharacterized protein YaaQ